MKRPLILLILSLILLAKSRAQSVIDTNRDAATLNLRSMSLLMSNSKCVRVAEIRNDGSDEYTTMIIFHHSITASDTADVATPAPAETVVRDTASIAALDLVGMAALEMVGIISADMAGVAMPDVGNIVLSEPFIIVRDTVGALDVAGLAALSVVSASAQEVAGVDVPEMPPVEIQDAEPVLRPPADSSIITPDVAKNAEVRMPVEVMHLSQEGYSLLEKLEGYAPALYNLGDGGYTIGFGFFVPYNESDKWSRGMTWEQAASMIQQKVPAYEAQVKEYVNVPLTQNEFDALTMLAYNLGGFSKATSIINDINEQVEFEKLQSDWKRFVHSKAPNVSRGLMRRRKDEIEVRKSSNYQPDRKIQVYKSKR